MSSNLIFGIGFLLFAPFGDTRKVFTIKELKGKPWLLKEPGMVSFPLETVKPSDLSFERTIERLLEEEIGISRKQVEITMLPKDEFRLIPGRDDIISLYGCGVFLGNTSQDFHPKDDDIVFDGWKTKEELLAQPLKRVEVAPIIEHYNRIYCQQA